MSQLIKEEQTYASNVGILLFLINILMVVLLLSEHVPISDGLGWDGKKFASFAWRFPALLVHPQVDSYYIQRIFPSAIIATIARAGGWKLSTEFLVYGFGALNILCINISFIFMTNVCRYIGLTNKAAIITLILTYVSFFAIKLMAYLPVNTDGVALALGTGLLYVYIRDRKWMLILLGFIGAFTHPLMLMMALLLYIFPRNGSAKSLKIHKILSKILSWMPYFTAIGFFLLCTGIYIFKYNFLATQSLFYSTLVNTKLYFISLTVASAYIYCLVRGLTDTELGHRIITQIRWKPVLLSMVVFAAVKILQHHMSNEPSGFGMKAYGLNIIITALCYPALFLVAHITFFGPGVLLIGLSFSTYIKKVAGLGTGYLALVGFICLLGLNSESRQLGFVFPFLMLPLGMTLQDRLVISKTQLWSLLIISLAISKIWLIINTGTFNLNLQQDPAQRFFLNIGPWMAPRNYVLQGITFLVIGGAMYFLLKRAVVRPIMVPIEKAAV